MASNFISFNGYRIKQSADKPSRFWIVDEATGKPVQIAEDRKGAGIFYLEGDFDTAKQWVTDNLLPKQVSVENNGEEVPSE